MLGRDIVSGIGAAISTTLIVAVVLIEALPFEFSAIVALPVGLLAGAGAGVVVARRYEQVDRPARALFDGSAGFGYTVVLLAAARYVGRLGLRSTVTFQRLLVAAVVVALLTAMASWLFARSAVAGR